MRTRESLTLQDLRYLVALAEARHFARAAEACKIGQSTLSTQIRKLEDCLGVALFDRSQPRVGPTALGEEIAAQARVVLEEVRKLGQLAEAGRDPMSGPLRIGVIGTLGPYLIPRLLPLIRRTWPKLRLLLHEDLTANLLDRLEVGNLDAALLALPLRSEAFEIAALFFEPFVVALPPGHPLAGQERVREKALQDQQVLLLAEGHCLRDQALAICGGARSDARDAVEATSLETLRQMVAAGIGCTLLPTLATASGVGALPAKMIELRQFAGRRPGRTIGLAWRRHYSGRQTVVELARLIAANLPAGVEPPTLVRRSRRQRHKVTDSME